MQGRDRGQSFVGFDGLIKRVLRKARSMLALGAPKGPPGGRGVYRDYLRRSLLNPRLVAPYDAEAAYVVVFMEDYGRRLAERYKVRPQSELISIVLATFNRGSCLGDAIGSVLAQTYGNWELLVVDDGSTDNTAEIVAGFKDERIKYHRLAENVGAAAARNVGLDNATGDLITYLDSDNTMAPDFLLVMSNQLQDGKDRVVYCAQRGIELRKGRKQEAYVRFAPYHRPSLENANHIDLGTIMHPRAVTEGLRFNAEMQRFIDWEFILRCAEKGSVRAIPAILSTYHHDKTDDRITTTKPAEQAYEQLDRSIKGEPVSRSVPEIDLAESGSLFCLSYAPPMRGVRRPVSIVVVSHGAPSLRASVAAIRAFSEAHEHELIVVDNASGASVAGYLKDLAREGLAKLVLNESDLGFARAANQGIGMASPGNDIVIMEDRAVPTRGWLDALQTVIADHRDAGLVVPTRTVPGGERAILSHQPFRDASRECDISISARYANLLDPELDTVKGYMELNSASFSCVYVPRETIELIGGIDIESATPGRSERLYCDMVREIAGRRIIHTPHAKVYYLI